MKTRMTPTMKRVAAELTPEQLAAAKEFYPFKNVTAEGIRSMVEFYREERSFLADWEVYRTQSPSERNGRWINRNAVGTARNTVKWIEKWFKAIGFPLEKA